jgi:hypothetical protein
MAKKQIERAKQMITAAVDCDTKRLYGTVAEAIGYLKEIAEQYKGTDIGLAENWTGYEDMEMRFEYTRMETDAEFATRCEQEDAEAARAAAEARRLAARREKEQQFEKLRRELGR